MVYKTKIMIGILAIIALMTLFILGVISWVNGIDYMQKNHPDYKGEDLFGEEETKEEK